MVNIDASWQGEVYHWCEMAKIDEFDFMDYAQVDSLKGELHVSVFDMELVSRYLH